MGVVGSGTSENAIETEEVRMPYEYWIEPMTLDEKLMGKTSARNVSERAKVLEKTFNQLAQQGWELVSIGQIDITGKIRKSAEVRDVSVAVFKRPL